MKPNWMYDLEFHFDRYLRSFGGWLDSTPAKKRNLVFFSFFFIASFILCLFANDMGGELEESYRKGLDSLWELIWTQTIMFFIVPAIGALLMNIPFIISGRDTSGWTGFYIGIWCLFLFFVLISTCSNHNKRTDTQSEKKAISNDAFKKEDQNSAKYFNKLN
jgi:hypothetical protein